MKVASACLVVASLFLFSCNRYIDKVKTERVAKVYDGELRLYADSNVLVYRDNLSYRADRDVWSPRPFYTRCPKGLLGVKLHGLESVSFYYKRKQVVSIYVNMRDTAHACDRMDSADTMYSQDTMYSTGFDKAMQWADWTGNGDLKAVPGTKTIVVKKEDAVIVFWNIEEKNERSFVATFDGFRFL